MLEGEREKLEFTDKSALVKLSSLKWQLPKDDPDRTGTWGTVVPGHQQNKKYSAL